VPPPGRVQVDAGQKRGEIGGGHLDAPGRGVRDAEGAAFEPLDLGITVPSFLWRYKISARPSCWGRESLVSMANVWDGSWE
jgi:hypothetical protein